MIGLKKTGHNATIHPLAKIVYPQNVSIGMETVIDDFAFLYGSGRGIDIGRFCHVTTHCILQAGGKLTMEDFSAIGPGGTILAASDDYEGNGFIGLAVFGDKYRRVRNADVHVKRHAHIGAGSIVLPGVTIGEGCSVGAGSVVTRDLPPWTICVGVPCKPVRPKPKEKQLAMEKEFLEEYFKTHGEIVVSICCLTYNHAAFIEEAIKGFLMQKTTFRTEIIIHDDASTDGTADIVRDYAAAFPDKIKAILRTENEYSKTGVYPIAKYVYPLARGRYIAECDGDDYWTDPLKLQKQVDFLEANPDFVMAYHAYRMHRDGRFIDPTGTPHDFSPDELVGYRLTDYSITTCTKVFRNFYSPETKSDFETFCGDYPLTVLMGLHGKCKFIEGIAPSVYRKHPGNSWSGLPITDQNRRTQEMYRRIYEAIKAKGNEKHTAMRKRFING